jgi:hypothetical protein
MFGFTAFSQAPFSSSGAGNIWGDSVNESIIAETDSESLVATFITAVSEALTVADSSAFTWNLFDTENLNAADSSTVVGSFAGSVLESYSIVDLPSAIASFISLISESSSVADSPAFTWNLRITEASTVTDVNVVLATFAYAVIEAISPVDIDIANNVASPQTVFEAITAADLETGLPTFAAPISEAITVGSAIIGGYSVAISETITVNDTKVVLAAFRPVISESVSLADKPTVIAAFVTTQTESFIIASSQPSSGWIKINDGQTPNWGNINDSQTPNWTIIFNNQ